MRKILFAVLLILVMVVLSESIYASDISIEASDGRTFEPVGTEFFLPSYIKPNSVKINYQGTETVTYTNVNGEKTEIKNGDSIDLTTLAYIDKAGKVTYTLSLKIGNSTNKYKIYFANNLPSIHVETSVGINAIVSENGKDAETNITIINSDGTYEYKDAENFYSQFKVRGNTTKDYAKKPFQMKLSTKADLYGMGSSKTWILLANYLDQSNIRNSVMYKIGSLLGMHTSEFKSVDLFVDGEYYGIYLLCEKVSISSSRIDIIELEKLNDALNEAYSETPVKVTGGIPNTIITEYSYIPNVVNPDDITGGYLVELDNNYWSSELCYFITEYGSHYVVKSPEYASKEQVEYIATFFGEMEEAIMSDNGYNRKGKHYTEYMDVNSFAYAYIVAEFSRNYDAGSSSMYFYKDVDKNGEVSKIVKGPLWDCDNTLGNILKNGAASTVGYWARERSIWGGLTKHSEFNALVTKELARVYDQIFDMIEEDGFIYRQVEEIGQSIHMERARWHSDDYSKWPLYYSGAHYDTWQSSQVFNFIDGYYSYDLDRDNTTVIGYLCEHIEARLNWLATEWDSDVELRERTFEEKKPPEHENPDDNTGSSTTSSTVDSTTNSSVIDSGTINSDTVDSSTTDASTLNSTKPGNQDNSQDKGNDAKSSPGLIIVLISVAAVICLGAAAVLFIKIKR